MYMQSRVENRYLVVRTIKAILLSGTAIAWAATVCSSSTVAQTLTDDSLNSCRVSFDPAQTSTDEESNLIVCEQPMIDTNRPLAALVLSPEAVPGPPGVAPSNPNEPPGEPNEPPGGWPPKHHGNWPHFPPIGHWDWPKHHGDWPKHHGGAWPKDHAWDWHKDKNDKWDPDPPRVGPPGFAHGDWAHGKHENARPAVGWESHVAGSSGLSVGEGWSHPPAGENAANAQGGFAGFGSLQSSPIATMGGFGAGFSGFGGWNPR
jgi:hypothetical protein